MFSSLPWLLLACPQAGDRANEESQGDAWRRLSLPPAPVLSPEEELATFRVADGYTVELIAAEPLVEDPVAGFFDPQGRLWVAEMRGFMPDINGKGEDQPTGRISVLVDEDADGRMDRAVRFLENLVLPRALAPVRGGVLVLAPPQLLFAEDSDGDLRCDRLTVVSRKWNGIYSPEHAPNGLLRGLDNRFHFSKHNAVLEWDGQVWQSSPAPSLGQWGVTMDDAGRLFRNHNSTKLLADSLPEVWLGHSGVRLLGLGAVIVKNQSVRPSRVTPGVNRGYLSPTLDDADKLRSVTAVCAPIVVRGGGLPDLQGKVLVAEPAANLVQLLQLRRDPRSGGISATPVWPQEQEFLTSTDERFRPVQLLEDPGGHVVVFDFYRGILQHKLFMTTWLREQVLDRGLDRPLGLGRIWRIRSAHTSLPKIPAVPPSGLGWLSLLTHESGFWRDAAQRHFVDTQDRSELSGIRALASSGKFPGFLHALWTLRGLRALDFETAQSSLRNAEEGWAQALQACAPFLPIADPSYDLLQKVPARWRPKFGGGEAARHAAYLFARAGSSRDQLLQEVLAGVGDPILRSAAVVGLAGREEAFLRILLADPAWQSREPGRTAFLTELSSAAYPENAKDSISRAAVEDPALQARLERGRAVFGRVCAACHGVKGEGVEGLAPSLNDPAWLGLPPVDLAKLVLGGLDGKIQANGIVFDLVMPALAGALSDDEVATVLTFVQFTLAKEPQIVPLGAVSEARAQFSGN